MNGSDSKSNWLEVERQAFDVLVDDLDVDVCVVGSGIAGLTTAYIAAKAGRRVVVLEAGERIVAGESGRTTAHLSNAVDDRYAEIERMHGETVAMLVADSHSVAIDRIEAIVQDEAIDCDFRRVDGYLIPAAAADTDLLRREYEAARRAGLQVELLSAAPGCANAGPALRFPRQAQLHPVKYLCGLAAAIVRHGGAIYTSTRVDAVEDGRPALARTRHGPVVRAGAVVMATNVPGIDRIAMHTKQAAYRTYVIGLDIPAGAVPPALYWDTADPYRYVRLAVGAAEGSDLLIVGGEDHKTGQADDADARFERLEHWARAHFSHLGAVRWRWSGQVVEPADALAFIGRNPDDEAIYIATGDSGNGMTHGTIAGLLLNDMFGGVANPWRDVYDPARTPPLRALGEYAGENLNVAAQYADWLAPAEVDDVERIAAGSGAIVRDRLGRLAVYRDADGALHRCDATCPHLGCVVQWNSLERSWDCPCHGSRFDPLGAVLCGPAMRGLAHRD